MQSLAVNGYSAADTLQQLKTSGNVLRFRYEWLDRLGNTKGWLNDIEGQSCSIKYDNTQDIKRTGQFSILDPEDQGFDFINDRIRPWVGVQMPDFGWADWAQGVFLLSSPTRTKSGGLITRQCEGYDQMQILVDDVFTTSYVGHAGDYLTDTVASLLSGIPYVNIAQSDIFFHFDRLWPAGTSKAQVLTDLFASLNYRSLWFDGMGIAQVQPMTLAQDRPVGITYQTDDESVIQQQVNQTLDLFEVPNVIVNVVSQPGMAVFSSKFVNSDPNSPVSTISRGRQVVKYDDSYKVTTKEALDQITMQQAMAAANIYETVTFNTMIIPIHEDHDIINVKHDALGISGNFEETGWSMQLKAGGAMGHTLRHIVNIDSSLIGDPNQYTGV